MDKKVGVDNRRGKEDGSKRTSHERVEPGNCVNPDIEQKCYRTSLYDDFQLFGRKLIHVHIRNGI